VQEIPGKGLAEQVQALVDQAQAGGDGAVALVQIAQQVTGFEFQLVQFAQECEQRRGLAGTPSAGLICSAIRSVMR